MTFWIIHIAALGLLSLVSFRKLKGDFPMGFFWAGLFIKLISGILLGYIYYEYYGSGDTISIFELAKNEASNHSSGPRTVFFIAILRPIVIATGGSYWLSSLWLSFVSFVACWYATITLSRLYQTNKYPIAICFLLIPSIVFWSSGILKDSLAFASLTTLVTLIIKYYKLTKLSWLDILLLILSTFLLFKIKHYLLIISLIFGGSLIAYSILQRMKSKWKWVISAIILLTALTSTQFIHPYLNINRLSWALYENNRVINQATNENELNITIENESLLAVIKEIPSALHAGLFRPSILDKTPIWGWVHKIENLILTVFIFLSILIYVKERPDINWGLIGISLTCIMLLAIMLSLAAPNFGTLVRYKNAFMPYLFLISSILPYHYLLQSRTNNR